MMVDDHTAASKDLMDAAQRDGVTVPTKMMEKQEKEVQSLEQTPAASFDASYIKAQIAAHKEALALMNSYAEGGESAALNAHAQKTAPVIEKHLKAVEKLGQ